MRDRPELLGALYGAVLVATAIAAPRYLIPQPSPAEVADEVVVLLNAEREALGLEPLVINEHLVLMAQWRSEDMAAAGYYSHRPPEGHPTLYDLGARFDYDTRPRENIVKLWSPLGRLDNAAERAVLSWKESRLHWLLATGTYQEMTGVGVAVRGDDVIVTQLFWDGGMFTPKEAYLHNRQP